MYISAFRRTAPLLLTCVLFACENASRSGTTPLGASQSSLSLAKGPLVFDLGEFTVIDPSQNLTLSSAYVRDKRIRKVVIHTDKSCGDSLLRDETVEVSEFNTSGQPTSTRRFIKGVLNDELKFQYDAGKLVGTQGKHQLHGERSEKLEYDSQENLIRVTDSVLGPGDGATREYEYNAKSQAIVITEAPHPHLAKGPVFVYKRRFEGNLLAAEEISQDRRQIGEIKYTYDELSPERPVAIEYQERLLTFKYDENKRVSRMSLSDSYRLYEQPSYTRTYTYGNSGHIETVVETSRGCNTSQHYEYELEDRTKYNHRELEDWAGFHGFDNEKFSLDRGYIRGVKQWVREH